SSTYIEAIYKNFNELGITDIAVQNRLIKKIESGQLLDSNNPEIVNNIPSSFLNPTQEEPVKVYTFPDGSVTKTSMTPITGVFHPLACGSGYCTYYDYLVEKRNVNVYGAFKVSYTINQGTSVPDEIIEAKDAVVQVTGKDISYSDKQLTVGRKVEIPGSAKAYARLSFTLNFLGTNDMWLEFRVGDDSTSVDTSLKW
ncbi:hypothetical protein, partial [Paenibacillus tyrfis]|uniref:hypothetical protein n=1 Tax=Paenibacillus tyrfis TaxID=1501230 RepID=UPI00055A7E63